MQKLTIKTKIDLSDQAQVNAAFEFIRIISERSTNNVEEAVAEVIKDLKASDLKNPSKKTLPKKEAPEAVAEKAPEAVAEKAPEVAAEKAPEVAAENGETSKHTIEEVREAMSGKVGSHRDAIKAKLEEYKAANISTLSTKHFDAFIAFLKKLQ